MRTEWLFSLLVLFFGAGCQADSTAQGDAARTPVEEAKLVKGQTPPTTDDALTMRIGSATAAAGSEFCLPVTVEGFTNLIGLQYTIRWDSTALTYQGVRNFNLSSLRAANFGERMTSRGYLASSWIDDRLTGVTLEAGTRIFDICFRANGKAGASAEVYFNNGPTTFEVIDANEQILRFRHGKGVVTIK